MKCWLTLMQRCRWWRWRCRRWRARKLSSGPEKGKQTNEINHTCYSNQQVPNAFYRWLAYGLAAWAHLVPWDWLGQRACASKCLVGLYRVNKIFEILEDWLYALCTRLAFSRETEFYFSFQSSRLAIPQSSSQCFCAGRVDFLENRSSVPVQLNQ
jgi:hypothetical protein